LSGKISDPNAFIELAQKNARESRSIERQALWCAAWLSLDAAHALAHVQMRLADFSDPDNAKQFAASILHALIGERRGHLESIYHDYCTANTLRDLYLLMLQYVRFEEDKELNGRVTSRHDLQDARDHLFALLKQIPGKESYLALLHIQRNHPNEKLKDYVEAAAQAKAELEADLSPMTANDVNAFARDAEYAPSDHRQLFRLTVSRLLDFKAEMEDDDSSTADTWAKVLDEIEHRKHIGGWLRNRAKGYYSVPQEEEMADAKRPDIRVHGGGMDCPVPVELKIADNGWTGPKLFERLENQLCGDYLRDAKSTCGIFFLLSCGTKKRWTHPKTEKRMTFAELILGLQDHADVYIAENPGIDEIKVIGVDLSHRSSRRTSSN